MSPDRSLFSHISNVRVNLRVADGVAKTKAYIDVLRDNSLGDRKALWHLGLKMTLFSVAENARLEGHYYHGYDKIELKSPNGLLHKVVMRDGLPYV